MQLQHAATRNSWCCLRHPNLWLRIAAIAKKHIDRLRLGQCFFRQTCQTCWKSPRPQFPPRIPRHPRPPEPGFHRIIMVCGLPLVQSCGQALSLQPMQLDLVDDDSDDSLWANRIHWKLKAWRGTWFQQSMWFSEFLKLTRMGAFYSASCLHNKDCCTRVAINPNSWDHSPPTKTPNNTYGENERRMVENIHQVAHHYGSLQK